VFFRHVLFSIATGTLPWLLALIGLVAVMAGPLKLPLDDLLQREISPLAWICAGILGLAVLYALLRLGLRGFLQPVLRFHRPGHAHQPGHCKSCAMEASQLPHDPAPCQIEESAPERDS
jgi:hypothetical protein